ncbi:MAG: glycoside hydrolase family 16 protein [Pseudoxanthomonas sp.]
MKGVRPAGNTVLLCAALQISVALADDAGAAGVVEAARPDTGRQWAFESTPAWRDEFDQPGPPDSGKWRFQQGGHGWGNHELQQYTDSSDNAFVENGVLNIVARKEKRQGMDYTSARLTSNKQGDFLYGRFEIRAKLPGGRGTWPALWMLPTDKVYGEWPKSGEIDLMEHVGFDPGRIHITMHTEAYNHRINTQRGATRVVADAMNGFHVYRTDWTPDAIRGYIDDQLVLEFPNQGSGPKAWPFDQRFHFLMNVAVGGDWGGKEGVDDKSFPATLQVDYVRVYPLVVK